MSRHWKGVVENRNSKDYLVTQRTFLYCNFFLKIQSYSKLDNVAPIFFLELISSLYLTLGDVVFM